MRREKNYPLIEPLESRIAPAAVVPPFTATHYSDELKNPKTGAIELQFINAASAGANPSIAAAVADNPNVYYIKVSAGEDVRIPTSVGFQDMVNVSKGTVVAFFTDFNKDGIVDSNELTGVALGTKTSVAIGTEVNGDIVTNYNDITGGIGGAHGVADLLPNTVTSLTVAGPITGAFVSGGAVSRFFATGTIGQILTGTAANGYKYTFDSTDFNTLSVATPAAGVAGPSIANVIIGSVTDIKLGAGGAGAAGGSVLGLTLLSDTTGFIVDAGAGGTGGAGRAFGGAGGSIANVVVNGPLSTAPDTTPNSHIVLDAGAGGNGSGSAKGGAGGAVTNVYVDYNSAQYPRSGQQRACRQCHRPGRPGGLRRLGRRRRQPQ